MERRLAAIMAGDVAGFTRLMADDQEGTYDKLRCALDDVVQPVVASHGGHIFKTTGDGFLAVFVSAAEAIDAAVAIQDQLADQPMQLRLGLNLGDVIDEGDDIFGDGVNIASRLEAMAEPGGICVSGAVVRSAGRRPQVRFERQGHRRGKNMAESVEVYVVRPRGSRGAWRFGNRRMLAAASAASLMLAVGGVAYHDGRPWRSLMAIAGTGDASSGQFATRPAVAVLPFDNLSGDPSQDYFSDGLTEDIITDLARNRELMVIARNSTFSFKDRATDVRTIGAQLGAGYIVEGSARRAGDQLRVVAQLIDANTGAHLWSKSYDRRIEDVFAVQDDLTGEIVASLVSYVKNSESEAVASRHPEKLRAYDLVLQARERYQHGSVDANALLDSRALLERAVDLDPGYAVARAHLGLTFIAEHMAQPSEVGTSPALEAGLQQVREALRLEPELALAHQVLSYGLAVSGDYEGGMRAARRAVELNASDPDSLMALAKAQVRFGSYEDAVASAEHARRLHPLAPQYYPYVHGQALYAAGRFEEAQQVLSECLVRVADDRNCLRIQVATLIQLDRMEEARSLAVRLVAVDPTFSIASEQSYRRFGEFPLMDQYLADLVSAGAPAVAAQA